VIKLFVWRKKSEDITAELDNDYHGSVKESVENNAFTE
jgi:hypothetical protein